MAQPEEHTPERPVGARPAVSDASDRTAMAAERTWLAWWRTALAATVAALGIGRITPEVIGTTSWPYIVIGAGYAALAVGLLAVGLSRQRRLQRAVELGLREMLPFRVVAAFTVGGIVLTVATFVVIVAST